MSISSSGQMADVVRRMARKKLFPIAAAGICAWYLAGQLENSEYSAIGASIGAVTSAQWAIALVATVASFAAVGQYDALFHRWLGTGVDCARAVRSGAAAIALAQTLGFGLATGTVTRWRALPELCFADALKLTNYVSFSFMIALGLLSAVAIAMLDPGQGNVIFAGLAVVALGFAVALSLARPIWLPVSLPPLRLIARLTLLAAIDTGLAAFALWVFLPGAIQPEFAVFFAAFLLALGAGFLSGAPGGVGPFELCMVALLPAIPMTDLIAAILAFRLVYYALPACIALVILARPKPAPTQNISFARTLPPVTRAEAGLARQSGKLTPIRSAALHLAPASQTLVSLGDPASGGTLTPSLLDGLATEAKARNLWPAVYRCSAKSALAARRFGWSVMPVADEAWIEPSTFSIQGPNRRQLRRKLRKAELGDISVEPARLLPVAQMTEVAHEWAVRNGGERGFSMGRYEPGYLSAQRCFLAWSGGKLLGFSTFHTSPNEWVLDLMRSGNDAPDGTMHALIAAAIGDAAALDIERVSLAAMPLAAPPALLGPISRRRDAQGLRRFKLSFAPVSQRLYMAAPNSVVLALAGLDILLRIRPTNCAISASCDDPTDSGLAYAVTLDPMQNMQDEIVELDVVKSSG